MNFGPINSQPINGAARPRRTVARIRKVLIQRTAARPDPVAALIQRTPARPSPREATLT